jgi:hypothetical protein
MTMLPLEPKLRSAGRHASGDTAAGAVDAAAAGNAGAAATVAAATGVGLVATFCA